MYVCESSILYKFSMYPFSVASDGNVIYVCVECRNFVKCKIDASTIFVIGRCIITVCVCARQCSCLSNRIIYHFAINCLNFMLGAINSCTSTI